MLASQEQNWGNPKITIFGASWPQVRSEVIAAEGKALTTHREGTPRSKATAGHLSRLDYCLY